MKDFIPIKTVYYDDFNDLHYEHVYIKYNEIVEIWKYANHLIKFKLSNGSLYITEFDTIVDFINYIQKENNELKAEERSLNYIENL